MKLVHDGYDMDDRTGDIAEVIETAIAEVGGSSALYRMMADHAARAVVAWLDYQTQTAPVPLAKDPGPIPTAG